MVNEQAIIKAGEIAKKVRDEVKEKILLNATFYDIIEFAEERILFHGGEIAWAQINDTTTAAHFSPTKENNPLCKEGDIIKVDIGVHIDGWIADTAFSVAIPTTNTHIQERNEQLIQTAIITLEKTLEICKPETQLRDLGISQETCAKEHGFEIITNLGGHLIDRYLVHAGITIPTYDNGDSTLLEEGMLIAIEPFITTGEPLIKELGEATVFMQVRKGQTRSIFGRKLIPYISKRNGLPFAKKDLEKLFPQSVVRVGLRDLCAAGIVKAYPPLVSVSNSPIAQAEHSVLIKNTSSIIYTK